jgi:SHS2 domain-containing protein
MKYKNFEILAHTSDFRLKVRGGNMEMLFISALEGMNSVLKNTFIELISIDFVEKLNISSIDSSMLLIDFLSEVLTLSHTKKAIFNFVEFLQLNETALVAEIKGKKVDDFDEDIKAVKYTENYITKNKNGLLESIIVFDI